MHKSLRWKFVLIILVTLACIFGVTGLPPSIAKIKQRIHLGLDLRGGMHLILQVVTDDAVNIETDLAVERIREDLRSRQIAFSEVQKRDVKSLEIRDVDPQKTSEVRAAIDEGFSMWDRSNLPGSRGMGLLHLHLKGSPVTDLSPLEGMPIVELTCDFKPERRCRVVALAQGPDENQRPAGRGLLEAIENCDVAVEHGSGSVGWVERSEDHHGGGMVGLAIARPTLHTPPPSKAHQKERPSRSWKSLPQCWSTWRRRRLASR